MISKEKAVEVLEDLISRGDRVLNQIMHTEDFFKWKSDSEVAIGRIFPGYLDDFKSIVFEGGLSGSSRDETYRRGIRAGKAKLSAYRDELEIFGLQSESASNQKSSANQVINEQKLDTVFVIHGRQKLSDFHAFLRAIGLKPLEWMQARSLTGRPNPYTWEVVDIALQTAGAIIVLLTPDDEARLREDLWSPTESSLEKEYLGQPRQNVLFEAGVAYGRNPDRTVLIRIGSHRPMSDLAGHHILQLGDSPQSRQTVADALRVAGCRIDLSGTDWHSAGSFSL